ncbi:MAG: efflux transporter outer membrane subunit [Acidobacteria bacterium]|nr:efflux transporter outer membrane subunit [Acidobacteriota bacterium]MBV9478511.1 efflux transporter outer membrane subunit [Acidobacteriota bacterium]
MMKRLSLLPALIFLAACTVGPNYQRPNVALPDQFYGATSPADAASLADVAWFDLFRDPTLRTLIDESLRNGFDVRIAAARVEEARARYGIAGSLRYPNVGYNALYEYGHTSEFASPSNTTGGFIVANVNVGWEADLWGRIRRLNEAARADYLATEEARRGVLLSLIAEVASAYFDLRELDAELEIARRNTAAFQNTADLFRRRAEGGTASGLDTARAEALLAVESAQIPLLERAIVAKENQLNLLLGRMPAPIPRGLALSEQPLPPSVPAGLPSALLLRRPDIRGAEQNLIAANADIGVAQAAFYPTLSLTGLLGGQSPELATLLGGGHTWSMQAGLLGPIFNAGRLRNQRRVALAQFDEARAAYERAITAALGEVSTDLVSNEKLAEAETLRAKAAASDRDAVRLATLRYESGFSAYFEVLDAQEQLLAAETGLAQLRRDRLVALVDLYRALGGGWSEPEPPASQP